MTSSHTVTRTIEFRHTDMAGVMHYANYFDFMESTEHDFFRSLGIAVFDIDGNKKVGWPRVHASCDYFAPTCYQEKIEVNLHVARIGSKSIDFVFILNKKDKDKTVVAIGKTTSVYSTMGSTINDVKSLALPAALISNLSVAPKEDYEPILEKYSRK